MGERATTAGQHVDILVALPLSIQTRMLLLSLSLARRVAHPQRMVPWCRPEAAAWRVEGSVHNGVSSLLQLDPSGGPVISAAAASVARVQVALALHHVGFGFRGATPAEADAALLVGAVKPAAAMTGVPSRSWLLEWASRAPLLRALHRVRDAVAGACNYTVADRELPYVFVRDPSLHEPRHR